MPESNSYATSINDFGQVGGIAATNKTLFSFYNGIIKKIPVFLSSSCLNPGCPPYINDNGVLAQEHVNNLGQNLSSVNGNLYLIQGDSKKLIDSESEWLCGIGYKSKINTKQQLAGTIRTLNNKHQAKFIDLKTGIKKLLHVKYSCTVSDINEHGDVVGWFQTIDGKIHSFLWNPICDNYQIIENFRASAINNNKVIVGSKRVPFGGNKGAIWENGIITILDDVLNIFGDMAIELETIEAISDINNSNDMVGWGSRVLIKPEPF